MSKWREPNKWKLMITTLPLVAGVIGLKLFLENVLQYSGSIDFADIGAVLTAVAFLIGFMLSGTISDYKEAEKMPGEFACTLESIEDAVILGAQKKGVDGLALRKRVFALTNAIIDYTNHKRSTVQTYEAFYAMEPLVQELDRAGATPMATRISAELASLRKSVTRMDVMIHTGFLAPGYALVEVMVTASIVLLMVSRFKSVTSEYVLITFITLVYIYMIRLIRDVDNPFESSWSGSAEVDPAPLAAYRERAELRLAQLEKDAAAAPAAAKTA